MRFSDSFLDEIRDRLPISQVIGARVQWDRRKTNAGRGDYWACCPFHGEKSPSFHCEDRKGRYHCFGCGVSGDHFRFLTELDGVPFPEAVERLADLAGVPMPVADPKAAERERTRLSLIDVMEMAAAFFESRLQDAVGANARGYLRSRGLTARTISTFRIGYAPESRNALKEHLAAKGVAREEIEACGLVVAGPDIPVSYDRFRDRIMFPILDARGRVIAFGGRALSSDALAKYLNSNETELFHKGNVLYNFARARKAAQPGTPAASGAVPNLIAVEGYMDVIALHQAGIETAVAPLGTALTENQLELMWRVTSEPVLCFDGDQAGQRAAGRAVDLALQRLRPGRTVRFVTLPDGKDPDDVVRSDGRGPFDRLLAQARPLADMLWTRETAAGLFETPERRAELEARLRQVVATISDESVRRHYQQNMMERMAAFFGAPARGGRPANSGGFRRDFSGGRGQGGERRGGPVTGLRGERAGVSERLARSALVRGDLDRPRLRECVLALTLVNHPALVVECFDEVAGLEFDHAELRALLTAMLVAASDTAAACPPLSERLSGEGFSAILVRVGEAVKGARVWSAAPDAALEDAREGFWQALALHKRSRALLAQKVELERDIAEATEAGDADGVPQLIRALSEVQLEIVRLENQDAMLDGFGVLSGRAKSTAGS